MEVKKTRISLLETYRNILSNFTEDHMFYLQVLVAVVIGLLIIYVLSRKVIKSITGSSILLVGGCGAGKSAFLFTLTKPVKTKTPLTMTSFQETAATYPCGDKEIKMIDIPGHERIRNNAFNKHKADARAILFILDSSTLQFEVRDIAQILYNILTDEEVQNNGCPIAVVCNKQDKDEAKAASIIEKALQREIDVLRDSTGNRLESIDAESNKSKKDIGVPGAPFTFADLKSNPVTFIESTILDAADVDDIRNWIETI